MEVSNERSLKCRTCGSENPLTTPISSSKTFKDSECPIYLATMQCTSVQLHTGDGMLEQMCTECVENLSTAFIFKRRCEEMDSKFRMEFPRLDEPVVPVSLEDLQFKIESLSPQHTMNEDLVKLEQDSECILQSKTSDFSNDGHHVEDIIQAIKVEEELVKVEAEDNQAEDTDKYEYKDYDGFSSYAVHSATKHSGKRDAVFEAVKTNKRSKPSTSTSVPIISNKAFKCDACNYSCNRKETMVIHQEIHNGKKPYKCEICGFASTLKRSLKRHKMIHSGAKPYKCEECEYATFRKNLLVTHKMTHSGLKPLKCDLCEYSCIEKKSLVWHKMGHNGEKPFMCEVCGYSFIRKGHLMNHKVIHSGVKRFKCDVCEYSCFTKTHLLKHNVTHTGEKAFKCDICELTFSQKSSLTQHQIVHTGEKPFKCNMCEYTAARKVNIDKHKMRHSGEKPFKCDFCDFSCNCSANLVRHRLTHTGEKPYKCDVCEYRCIQKTSLIKHKRKHS